MIHVVGSLNDFKVARDCVSTLRCCSVAKLVQQMGVVDKALRFRLAVLQLLDRTATKLECSEDTPVDFDKIRPEQPKQVNPCSDGDASTAESAEVAHNSDQSTLR